MNKHNDPNIQIDSFEQLVDEFKVAMDDYKQKVNSLGLNESDRKKILALPFYLAKR